MNDTPVHMIFAPTGTLKIRSKDYHRIHAELRNEIAEAKMSRILVDRHNQHLRVSQRFKQTGEYENV